MPRRPRKSSACVTLVLIGAAALTGCGDSPPSRRASYATKEACLADWGDPKECEERTTGGSAHYWGPSTSTWHSYSSGRSSSSSRSGTSTSRSSSSSTSRGGFGSHGSSSAS